MSAVYLYLALFASEATFPLNNVTVTASLAVLSLGLGLSLAWHGLRAWGGDAGAPFNPPRSGLLLLSFTAAVAAGQAVLSFDSAPRLLFPPFHVLAGALPAMIILALVGRRLGKAARQRDIIGQMACGILIGGPGAIVLVGLAGLLLVFSLSILVALRPGGLETLQTLTYDLQNPIWWENPDNLMTLIFTPAGISAVLLLTAVIGPLVEEMLKPVGVLLVPRRPGRAEAFLWGLAGACGFALTEGMLNSAIDLNSWVTVVLMRVGTSITHCLTGGLMGLGWYSLRTARRPWRAIGLYLLAVTLHGLWNFITLGIGGLAFGAAMISEAMANLGIVLLLGALLALLAFCIAALIGLVRWLQNSELELTRP